MAMEVLGVLIENPTASVNGAVYSINFSLATKNFGTTQPTLGIGDATVLAMYRESQTFTTSGMTMRQSPVWYPSQDGAGHGVLVGNQNLYWVLTSVTTSATNRINVKVLYRAKKISDSELLGIVLQSNQN